MTAAKMVKQYGLKSMKEFSQLSAVPISTLNNWYGVKQQQFKVLLLGAYLLKHPKLKDYFDE